MGPLMDKQQLADYLVVPIGWVEQATKARALPIVKVGKHIRFDPADIDLWLETCKELPAGMPARIGPRPAPQPTPRPTTPQKPPARPAGPATPVRPAGPRRAA